MDETRQWQNHSGHILDSLNGFVVIECEPCGFKHIVPIPTTNEIVSLYPDDYYSKEKPLYIEHHREDIAWWNMVYEERYCLLEEYLPPQHRSILDVGCGPGFFLKLGQERGWKTLGIEPSRQAADHARQLGLEIINDFLSTDNFQNLGAFNVVHLHEVLEHIPNPAAMLGLCHRLLVPDGLLCVIVPNDYNPLQKILREEMGYKPWWVAPPHHINYFNLPSLKRLIENCGFEIMNSTATFPIELFLLMGDNYVGDDELGRICHGKRKRLELALENGGLGNLKHNLYANFAEHGIGREIMVIGRIV